MTKSGSVVKDHIEIEGCQIETPPEVIKFFWNVMKKYRKSIKLVGDLGAGDGRFSVGGNYKNYLGFEYDNEKIRRKNQSDIAKIINCDILDISEIFNACIGNPPYVRHHSIHEDWRSKASDLIENELEIKINHLSNLFVYFFAFAIMKTSDNGIIALVIPYEWVSRPSTKYLRDYIKAQGWSVDVYQFTESGVIFPNVLTTASLTIVDKNVNGGLWQYFSVDKEYKINKRRSVTKGGFKFLPYEIGGDVKAHRGFSPGSQKVFTLTESERILNKLRINELEPCVTSLREIPNNIKILNNKTFDKYFIKPGKKCWLLKTEGKLSRNKRNYLKKNKDLVEKNWTCNNREIWYKYKTPQVPSLIYSSGFVKIGPKIVENHKKAIPLGSAHGVYGSNGVAYVKKLRAYIKEFDFETKIVHHANALRKVEVRQMNGVINQFMNSKEE